MLLLALDPWLRPRRRGRAPRHAAVPRASFAIGLAGIAAVLSCRPASASDAAGFNFRGTVDYAADFPDETYVQNINTYPTKRAGRTFGWNRYPDNGANLDKDIDRRLAGVNSQTNNGEISWQLDLPASGTYLVHLAIGDANNPRVNYLRILDDTTVRLTVADGTPTAAGHWLDATGADLTAVTWPSNELPLSVGFESTTLRIEMSFGPGSDSTALAHVRVETCSGDCGRDGAVTVDELVTMVNIALGSRASDTCIPGDLDGDGAVTIDEVIAAVNRALSGCII